MLFNSYVFIFAFLPISFILYFLLIKLRYINLAKIYLIVASLFFYGWWNFIYVFLLLASISTNYLISQQIINSLNKRKMWFIIGLVFNIALLCYFKYMDFFIDNINYIFNTDIPLLHIVLPLGISFFTITQIAYLTDCYEKLSVDRSIVDYGLFVTYFPHLLAGPILHHKQIMPQFKSLKTKFLNFENITKGLFIFFIGLFKKVIIADQFAIWANLGYESVEKGIVLNLLESWASVYSYAFQLYFDFSGYCDMAIGASLLFNIVLPINFNSPLKATNMIDFWKRWHISLTNFITAYIYTPLLKSFKQISFTNAMIATIITFLIAGFWHGAGWNFIIFGFLNGIGIVINHIWSKKLKFQLPKIIAWFITFNFINITWVFFRAKTLDGSINMLKGMFGFGDISLPSFLEKYLQNSWGGGIHFGEIFLVITTTPNTSDGPIFLIFYTILAFIITLSFKNSIELKNNFKPTYINLFFMISLSIACIANLNKATQFLYFDF